MTRNGIRRTALVLTGLALSSVLSSCVYVEQETFTSPEGTNTVLVKYDPLCRPTLFKKGWLWDTKIWDYPRGGFMETVHFGVEWLSEQQLRLVYDDVNNDENDEAYLITIPD